MEVVSADKAINQHYSSASAPWSADSSKRAQAFEKFEMKFYRNKQPAIYVTVI
jgi:hypothetical protein